MAKAKRAQKSRKRESKDSGQQFLPTLARRVQRIIQFEAAAGTYLAELAPFSLPPEDVQINARPNFYVTGVFVPEGPSWADAQRCLRNLLHGKEDRTEFQIGAGKLAELFTDFALNLNYSLLQVPDKDGHWQVRQDLSFGDHTVLLESRWDRTNRSVVQWYLRRRPRANWVPPLSTLLIPFYDDSRGLTLGRTGEEDDE